IRVDEDDLEALLAQGLAGLSPRVVELAGLADDDRPRPDQEDLLDVGALGHARLLLLHEPVDDGDLGRGLLALVEHVVQAARAHPGDFAGAPELLAEHADALLDSLAHGVGFHGGVALGREAGPLGLLPGFLGLAVRNQILGHGAGPPSISVTNRSNRESACGGAGGASGWYWTENPGSSRCRMPSDVPSLRLTWLSTKPAAATEA